MIQSNRLLSKKGYKILSVLIVLLAINNYVFGIGKASASVNETKVQLSIMNGVNYLINSANPKPEKDAALVINYINEHYHLHLPYPTMDVTLNKIVLNSENLRILGRWFNPKFVLDSSAYEKNMHGLDSFMLVSLYCQKYGLPAHFLAELDSTSKLGGYELTHSCLQFQWCVNNGCLELDSTTIKLRKKLVQRLSILLSQQKEKIYDVGIEAIAVHDFMNIPLPDKSKWIKRILASQLEDGGWAAFENDHNSYPHASALATWVLVDYILEHPSLKDSASLENMTGSELYSNFNILAKIDSNIRFAGLNSIFSFHATSADSGYYTGAFLKFKATKSSLLKSYYAGVNPPSLRAAINSTDSLAYLIEYKHHFTAGNSNELLDTLLAEAKTFQPKEYANYLKLLVIKRILEEKKIFPSEKIVLANLKNKEAYTSNEQVKILELFIRKEE